METITGLIYSLVAFPPYDPSHGYDALMHIGHMVGSRWIDILEVIIPGCQFHAFYLAGCTNQEEDFPEPDTIRYAWNELDDQGTPTRSWEADTRLIICTDDGFLGAETIEDAQDSLEYWTYHAEEYPEQILTRYH